jgi:hypothetical protein
VNKRFICLLLSGIFIFLQLGASPGNAWGAEPVRRMPFVSSQMLSEAYWIDKLADPEALIMTPPEIHSFNQQMLKELASYIIDLKTLPLAYSAAMLQKFIDQPFPKKAAYVDGIRVGDEYFAQIKEQMNLGGIQGSNLLRYGVIVRRTNLKIFPTAEIVSDAADDPAFDMFQDSALLVNEPVAVLHQSKDQQWFFIRMYFCSGWVRAEDVALLPDRASWLEYQAPDEDFLVVTGNHIKLDRNPFSPALSGLELSMGTILPLATPEEIPQSLDGRATYDNYVVKVPVRNNYGQLSVKLAMIPVSKDVSVGFLPYTRANLLRQAFKLDGDRYGWGGMLEARDCSALVLEIYRCFGFNAPRNSSPQGKAPGKVTDLTGLGQEARRNALDQLQPGATLHFPGHVMFYLGKDNNRYYVISALGSYAEFSPTYAGAKIIRTRSVVINDLSIKRASGLQWIEALTSAKQWE